MSILLPVIASVRSNLAVTEAAVLFQPGDDLFGVVSALCQPLARSAKRMVAALRGELVLYILQERREVVIGKGKGGTCGFALLELPPLLQLPVVPLHRPRPSSERTMSRETPVDAMNSP